VEDGYEFFAKRHLVTLFSAPNYCGEFDNAGAMMSVDETLLCSFQVSLKFSVLTLGSGYICASYFVFATFGWFGWCWGQRRHCIVLVIVSIGRPWIGEGPPV
jgi:hypothetical protein